LVNVVATLGVIKPCTCSYTRTLRFWHHTVVQSWPTWQIRLSGSKNKCWARASNWGPFTTLWPAQERYWSIYSPKYLV